MNDQNRPDAFISDATVIDSYGKGWAAMASCFWILLAIVVVAGLIEAPSNLSSSDDESGALAVFSILWGVFLSGPIGMSVSWTFLKAVRRERVEFVDMFSVFTRNYWNAVGAGVLVFLIVLVGLILLIIPGIYLACRLAFVNYLIIDRKMGAAEAIQESWNMTRGHTLTVFLMGLLAIPLAIAGLLALIVGIFPAIMWIAAAGAVLYHTVCVRRGEGGQPELPADMPPAPVE